MGVFVKICGIARAADAEAVAAFAPDAMGFIFWPRSPRAVRPADVAAWTRGLPKTIQRVGVFVDASAEEIARVREQAGLDIVQIHSDATPAFCATLAPGVWKVAHLDRMSAEQASAYSVDALLIDQYSTVSPGGTGMVADWDAAARFVGQAFQPVLLAGGLRADNVGVALQKVEPWGVDVSSGVEASPGVKDLSKVKAFIEQCRKHS